MDKANSVAELKCINFNQMDLHQKMFIKELGRPTPDLKIIQEFTKAGRSCVRRFNPKIYERNVWICGCDITNSFYCFPCILLGGEPAWTSNGVSNLKNMSTKIPKHECSIKHIQNIRALARLGNTRKFSHTDSVTEKKQVPTLSIKEVEKSRLVLSKLMDFIKLWCDGKLPVYSVPISKNSEDTSNSLLKQLHELINYSDANVKNLLEKTDKFNWNSKEIPNKILNCVLCIIQQHIRKEISRSLFLSIIVNDTSYISQTAKAALIVRYVKNKEVVERFWCFLYPNAEDPLAMAECILRELKQILPNCPEKLIAQSYDGSPAMNNVYFKIREVYPNAAYIHAYAHDLYSIVRQVASQNGKARLFFSNLDEFSAFLSTSSQRAVTSNANIKNYDLDSTSEPWDFEIRLLDNVYEQQMGLLECFQSLKDDDSVTLSTAQAACNLEHLLTDKEFKFWLMFYYFLMPHVYILKDLLSCPADSLTIKRGILEFMCSLERERGIIEEMDLTAQIVEEFSTLETSSLKQAAQEVCELISIEMTDRFQFTDCFDIANIFQAENFPVYQRQLPQNLIDTAVKICSSYEKDGNKLRLELSLLYKLQEFTKISSPQQLLQFITQKNLETTFSETVKFIKLVLTFPIVTSKQETCFSALERLRKFLRRSKTGDHLTAITAMHMEKTMILDLPYFNEEVINLFLSSPAGQ